MGVTAFGAVKLDRLRAGETGHYAIGIRELVHRDKAVKIARAAR
jgi:hypothetical protein